MAVCPQLAAYEKVRQSKLGQLQALASSFQVCRTRETADSCHGSINDHGACIARSVLPQQQKGCDRPFHWHGISVWVGLPICKAASCAHCSPPKRSQTLASRPARKRTRRPLDRLWRGLRGGRSHPTRSCLRVCDAQQSWLLVSCTEAAVYRAPLHHIKPVPRQLCAGPGVMLLMHTT